MLYLTNSIGGNAMSTVNYIQNTNENLELIIYKTVTHSYPTHNHSQSFTIGLLVSGQLS